MEQLYAARYGGAAGAAPSVSSPVIDALLQHRSVRAYLPDKPVGDDTLSAIIAAAQSAPTSSNLNAWSVVAVRDTARKSHLAELVGNQEHVRQAPLFLVWLADLARLSDVVLSPAVANDYFEMFLLASLDATLAAQNASTAAESLGLGTVFIGGIRNKPEEVAKVLELPPRVFAVAGMCVGYPDPRVPTGVKPRLPQSVVLHSETYKPVEDQKPAVTEFDGMVQKLYEKHNIKGGWIAHSTSRVATVEAMTGRDRLLDAVHTLGFPLK